MSDSIDWRSIHVPAHSRVRPPRSRRWPWLVLALVAIVLFGGRTWLSYYVNALWFSSLGYADVFWKSLSIQWLVFSVFTAATFLILYGAYLALKSANADALSGGHTIWFGNQPFTMPIRSMLRVISLVVSIGVGLLTGAVMMAQWPIFALYWSAPRGGVVDPIFAKPLSFYLFTLPAWQVVSGWLLLLALVVLAAAFVFALIAGGSRAVQSPRAPHPALRWNGLSAAAGFLLLVIALRVYLGRFDSISQDHTIFSGVTYTDAHVTLTGLLVVCLALIFGAAVAFVNAFRRARFSWLVAAALPAIVCSLVVQLFGWYVTSFVVKPNQLVRERPYIAHNIDFTRRAYGLDRVSRHEFPAETTVAALDIANNQPTLHNIRLWDWRALQDTLRQIQEIRTYYDFPDIDIDRYQINGSLREVMLATRELNVDRLPESSRNWINEKLIYTHGYGVTMNPVNGFTPEGLPNLILSNMPVESTVPGIRVTRPEVYFGELTKTDVYVKTRQKEFNYPQGQTNQLTSYEGTGGIVIGGFFRRFLIALDRGDVAKLPFSDDVTPESRLLMRRTVLDRVKALAPFLTFDPDPYIVIGDNGRLYWIMDAFATTDMYPYSTHYGLGQDSINYMRNSVKAVIDAYDGSTTFYVFDSEDPIVGAYRRIFPSLFKDVSAMPPDLRRHVRYPELLLQMQAAVYGLYHMTDPEVFYNREDLWTVASEVSAQSGQQSAQAMEPNFVLMKLPGESGEEFVEMLPFTPANRNNLIGWIAGRSDGAAYGSSVVYDFPKTKLVDGPLQIEARIDQNAQLSAQLSLWNQQGSHVRRGTMLVIPSGHALLYVEPIYLQAERSPMPELRLVVLAIQDRLAYGPTFESAVAALFGGAPSTLNEAPSVNAQEQTAPSAPAAPQPAANLNALIKEAAADLADYQRLTSQGKLGEAGQKLEQLKKVLDQLNAQQK